MNKKALFIFLAILTSTIMLVAGTIGEARAQYREIIAELADTFHATGDHLPRWEQFDLTGVDAHPIGCGAVSWAMVYGYWSTFHGKTNLFGGTNLNPLHGVVHEGNTPAVRMAMEEIAVHLGTEFGNYWNGRFGRTWARDMPKGIQYAIKNGYRHSRVWRIRGTEHNKFVHVKRYLDANRPVIITMKHGLDDNIAGIIPTHYAVIEKAVRREKWVNGEWKERDVRYDVKFGHGVELASGLWDHGVRQSTITVREKGRNTDPRWSSYSFFLVNVSDSPLTKAADINEEACKEWCNDPSRPECVKCSTKKNCGVGFERLASFTEAGTNWHACAEKARSEESHAACESYCVRMPTCVKCSTLKHCGVGFEHLRSFGDPGQTKWHACAEKGRSAENRAACEAWCNAQPNCVECSTVRTCGRGHRRLKSWTGAGRTNWHACGRKRQTSNRDACEAWCDARSDCVRCDTAKNCGVGFERLLSFTSASEANWHACAEKARSRDNHAECDAWCKARSDCVMCSTKRNCGEGFERLESFTGFGETNWHACTEKARSVGNRAACEAWCRANAACAVCSTKYGCGPGYKNMNSWRGVGETNWHACSRR